MRGGRARENMMERERSTQMARETRSESETSPQRRTRKQPSNGGRTAREGDRAQRGGGARGSGRMRRVRGSRGSTGNQRPHKKSWVTRQVTQWCNRLLGAVSDRSFHEQDEVYEAHRTTRDFVWNSIALGAWGMVFPILSIVATRLVGEEQAGMFSMAFVTATLLMIVANYGVRTYQISDIEEHHSFADYQVNRLITCVIMMVVGYLYCQVRGYGAEMFTICMAVFTYRMVDGFADVYEGRLQQKDKLYLAGISQALRSIAVLAVFSAMLFVTRSLVAASIAMAVVSVVSLAVLTVPLTYFETPKSRPLSLGSVIELLRHCFPVFFALFAYSLIDNMPKFVMEGVLDYSNQLYYNALYFPAQCIHLVSQFVYKPMLVKMANVWNDASKRRRFDIILGVIMLVIVAVTVVMLFVMATVGIPVLSFLYGIDFEEYRGLAYVMLAAGGVMAGADFLYQTVTVLRRQNDVIAVYVITLAFSLFVPVLLVSFTGLRGAVLSFLIIMCILFVLLIWVYAKIRIDMARHPERDVPDEEPAAVRTRTRFVSDPASEAAAERDLAERERVDDGIPAAKVEPLRPARTRRGKHAAGEDLR